MEGRGYNNLGLDEVNKDSGVQMGDNKKIDVLGTYNRNYRNYRNFMREKNYDSVTIASYSV